MLMCMSKILKTQMTMECPTADMDKFFAPAPKSATVPGNKKKNLYMNTNEMIVRDMKIVQWWGVCLIYLNLYNILNSYLAQCTLVFYVGVSSMRLPIHYGIFSVKQEGLFISWNHNQ